MCEDAWNYVNVSIKFVGSFVCVTFVEANYRIYSLISRTFLPGIWAVFCLRLIRATYPEGQSFRMSYHRISVIQSNRKCHLAMGETRALYRAYRRTSFFRRRRFLQFWTIKLTFITFAWKINILWLIDRAGSSAVKRSIDLAVCSWITLDSRYMAKISAAAYLRMRLISEYVLYMSQLFDASTKWNALASRRVVER